MIRDVGVGVDKFCNISVNWSDGSGFRYHIWCDPNTYQPQIGGIGVTARLKNSVIIYKNAIERDPGTGRRPETRHLDGSNATNQKIIAEVLARVDIPKAVADKKAEIESEQLGKAERNRLNYIRDCKKEAGEELYDAAKDALAKLVELSPNEPDLDDLIEKLRAAIKTANRDALTLTVSDFT